MRYVLNSAVITGPGVYGYRLISKEDAAAWVQAEEFASRVGYPNTAQHIKDISGIRPPLSREATAMQPGDEALVVRLKYRMTNPGDKATFAPGAEDWEYGILTMCNAKE